MPGNVVFISYAHESEEHKRRVQDLARALLRVGWDVRLDRYAGAPVKGWPHWMATQIHEADVVLCICTTTYRHRFEGTSLGDSEGARTRRRRSGLGVSWEGHHLTTRLYLRGGRDPGVFAVLAGEATSVPTVMASADQITFDVEVITTRLGPRGAPIHEPTLSDGYDATFAADPTGLLAALFKPIEPVEGMAPLDVAPSTFLRPEHAVVPFHGREAELAELDAWCASAADVSVKLVHGPGGAGKTRLALELCARRSREGWRSGPLHRDPVERHRVNALFHDPIPALVVVDYAEGRPEDVAVLVEEALNGVNGPVRILLLARHASEWADRLRERVPGLRDAEAPSMRLEEGERGSVALAAEAFRRRLGLPLPARLPPDRGTALDRHVDAFLAVVKAEGDGIVGLVDHERTYLRRVAKARNVDEPIMECLPGAVALATLAQGIAEADVESWIRQVSGLGDLRQAELLHVGRVLRDVYPGDDDGVSAVRPDRVGEVYVARQDPDGVLGGVACERGKAVEALTVLTRLAQQGGAETPLQGILARRWTSLVEPIVAVGIATGDPIGRWTASLLEEAGDAEWARRAEPLIPGRTTALRELAETVTRLLLAAAEDGNDAALGRRAATLNNLSLRQADLGRLDEALESSSAAVALFRPLAAARPAAFMSALAATLNNHGLRLGDLGRLVEALAAAREAVALNRHLASLSPAAIEPDLIGSLNNLGQVLSELGRWQEALAPTEEAEALCRRLASSGPDAFESEMARCLHNLGLRLSDVGRREAALAAMQEAVALRRRLASACPDAFEPDLAKSLNSLGGMLSAVGRREDALAATQEALAVRRRLASARPDAFEPELARSLNNLSCMLSAVGRREEALAITAEAVGLRRRLALTNPDGLEPELAKSLGNLANGLSEVGRKGEALAAMQEAATLYRRLASSRPEAFAPEVARSLHGLGAIRSDLGRREDALAATKEAVALWRRLVSSHPDIFAPDLATSLVNLGNHLSALGHREDALAAAREAVALRRQLASKLPDVFQVDLARSLANLGNRLLALGRRGEALAAMQEAVALQRGLASARPAAVLPDLANGLWSQGRALRGLGREAEAAAACREGLLILLPFVQHLPEAHRRRANAMANDHRAACKSASIEPDHALLAQLAEALGPSPRL